MASWRGCGTIVTVSHGSIVTVAKKFWMLTAIAAPSMPSLGFPIRPTRELTVDVYGELAGISQLLLLLLDKGNEGVSTPHTQSTAKIQANIYVRVAMVHVKMQCPLVVELAEPSHRNLHACPPQF